MVIDDETAAAAVARRQEITARWQHARESIWRLDAEYAIQIDLALRGNVDRLLTRLAADHHIAVDVWELARLAWDELCETPDPRLQPHQLEA